MQAAPTIGSIFVDSIDDCKEDLDTRVIPYAQYCPDWVPNSTSGFYPTLNLTRGFGLDLPQRVVNIFLVYLTSEIPRKFSERAKRPELFSIVLVWLGHIVQKVVRSQHAAALKELANEYVSETIAGLELSEVDLTRPTAEEYLRYYITNYGNTEVSDLRTGEKTRIEQEMNAMGDVELFLHNTSRPYLLDNYFSDLKADPTFSPYLKSHKNLADNLEVVLDSIKPEEGVTAEVNENNDLFTIGMDFLVAANELGVAV
eukprot:augustus_masked-scaffold_116-processed-gene-0.1-mRNA-1 protein AED:1.00 eAED:1.00 QI:0/-1/0/0/-1/1/1/0/256